MFPITYKNRFVYKVQAHPSWTANRLREYLAQGLAREGAKRIVVEDKVIRFNGNPWALFRWHFFHMISKGKITVDYHDNQVGAVYQISFIDYFVMFLVVIGFWIFGLLAVMQLPLSMALAPSVFAFFWFGLFYGGSAALNYYLFNRFIKNRLREFFNSAANSDMHGELITSR
jgi:hypothetical protein